MFSIMTVSEETFGVFLGLIRFFFFPLIGRMIENNQLLVLRFLNDLKPLRLFSQ